MINQTFHLVFSYFLSSIHSLLKIDFSTFFIEKIELSPALLIGVCVLTLFLIILLYIILKRNKVLVKKFRQFGHKENSFEADTQNSNESEEQIKARAVFADILRNVSGKERSIPEFLNDALDRLLNLPWLKLIKCGSVFMINENGMLEMVAEKNMGEHKALCSLVKPGECICGKAYSENEIQYAPKSLQAHKTVYKDMAEHGHFTIPIRSGEQVEGVLNLYIDVKHHKTSFEEEFLLSVADTLGSVINRKKAQLEISRNNVILIEQKHELQVRNEQISEYLNRIESQAKEMEKMNELLLAQKNQQENLNQKLFAQKLEVEQRNFEIEQYTRKLEEQTKEQEKLNQRLFAQKLEVEQRNFEVELYSKQLVKQSKEQEHVNQILFAQKLEVEQRNMEVRFYAENLEKQKREQDKLNQKLFAQSLEVDQRSFEIELYAKEINKLKLEAETAYKNISDSINYSKTIQDSLLPNFDLFNKYFAEHYFLFYKPKDIIGGDLYFINQVNDFLIFAVADCTGHGVPGALITMLGLTYLQDISERNIAQDTAQALEILRIRFKESFKAYGKDVQNKNGMDIALCALNLKTGILQFSGAFLPLIIIREGEIMEYLPVRNPIGFYPVEKNFETVHIELHENDLIYLFSDGFQDQVGGKEHKKFLKRKFYELLKEIGKYPMIKQKEFIEKILNKWMGRNHQIDDITIMGIRWLKSVKDLDSK